MRKPPHGAGSRDRKIVIEQRATTPAADEYGKPVAAYTEVATVWARVQEVVARDRMRAPQVVGVRAATFTILYRDDLSSSMTVRYDGRRWAIRGLAERTDAGRRFELEILAEVIEQPGAV